MLENKITQQSTHETIDQNTNKNIETYIYELTYQFNCKKRQERGGYVIIKKNL